MQTYDFNNRSRKGQGAIYKCVNNGKPIRPELDDPEYDPEALYFEKYKNSIIIGMSITNNNEYPIKTTVYITKENLDTSNIIYDVEINPSETLIVVGEDQKVFMEYDDMLSFSVKSNNDIDQSLIHCITSFMNLYDFGFIPPIWTPPIWFGDIGFATNGESNATQIDTFDFVSDTFEAGFASMQYSYYGRGAGSNGIIGIVAGGANNQTIIESVTFSNIASAADWGSLSTGTSFFGDGSNGTICLWGGGYSYMNLVQMNEFSSAGASTSWSTLYNDTGKYYLGSTNSADYALWIGGLVYSSSIQYSEFSSQVQAQLWGNLWRGNGYRGDGCGNREVGLYTGDGNTYYADVHKITFASQGDTSNFGELSVSYIYENYAVSNENKALFGGDEYYGDDIFFVDFAAEFSTSVWGLGTYFDGGSPAACSGG